jgi:choline dehydrogenase
VDPALRDGWNNPGAADWHHDWGLISDDDGGGAGTTLRRGRLLGGTSWLTRFAVRGSAADFDAWAARGNHGWSYADVLPSFRRLETDVEYGNRPSHGDRGPMTITRYPHLRRMPIHEAALEALTDLGIPSVEDHNSGDAVGAGPMPMSTRDGRRITTLDAYLGPPRPRNLTIRAEAQVANVIIERGRARGVRLLDATEIRAGWVILSAGTYGSAALLLRSGVGPAADLRELGIQGIVDLPGVGANLADHPGVDLDSGWHGEGRASPVLHSIATFRNSDQPADAAPDLMFWLIDPAGEDAAFYLDPILLKPESRGAVRLQSADPAERPRIRLPGLDSARDVERLSEGYRLGLAVANHPAIRRLATMAAPAEPSSKAEMEKRLQAEAYSNPHVVGTCRMGPAPLEGDVVDARGQVHGVDGLSVIDASVIPDPPSGFPHLITIMLAEHLSESFPAVLGAVDGRESAAG